MPGKLELTWTVGDDVSYCGTVVEVLTPELLAHKVSRLASSLENKLVKEGKINA